MGLRNVTPFVVHKMLFNFVKLMDYAEPHHDIKDNNSNISINLLSFKS